MKNRTGSRFARLAVLALCLLVIMAAVSGCAKSDKTKYQEAQTALSSGDYAAALTGFEEIQNYEESSKYIMYIKALQLADQGQYSLAATNFNTLTGFLDSDMYSIYFTACQQEADGEYLDAEATFAQVAAFKDGLDRMNAAYDGYVAAEIDAVKAYYDDENCESGLTGDDMSRTRLEGILNLTYRNEEKSVVGEMWAYVDSLIELNTHDDLGKAYELLGVMKDQAYTDEDDRATAILYKNAQLYVEEEKYETALLYLEQISDYSETAASVEICNKAIAEGKIADEKYGDALTYLNDLGEYDWKADLLKQASYGLAGQKAEEGSHQVAYDLYIAAGDYSDAADCAAAYETAYADALALVEAGEYDKAVEAFEALKDYSDAATQIDATYYAQGEALRTDKDWAGAVTAFTNAGEYSDAATQINATYYAQGEALRTAEDWEGAVTAFTNAGDYSNAVTQISETYYQQAKSLMEKEDYVGAYVIFRSITGYSDVDKLLSSDEKLLAVRDAQFSVGNYVTFGMYPQTSTGNDDTPIEWLVLERDGNKALLISRYGLDAQPYNKEYVDMTWEKCSLRTWLNDAFMNKAFTATEQEAILLTDVDNSKSQGYSEWSKAGGKNTQDKIFLLSYAEANEYFAVTYVDGKNTKSRVEPTAYAIKQGAYTSSKYKTADGKDAGWWWLRSPGSRQDHAANVTYDGSLDYYSVNAEFGSVRPALWVNLESGVF